MFTKRNNVTTFAVILFILWIYTFARYYFIRYTKCICFGGWLSLPMSCACMKASGGPDGNSVSTANSQPAADESHSQHSAQSPQQAPVTAAGHGEGCWWVSEFSSRWSHTENQGSDAVGCFCVDVIGGCWSDADDDDDDDDDYNVVNWTTAAAEKQSHDVLFFYVIAEWWLLLGKTWRRLLKEQVLRSVPKNCREVQKSIVYFTSVFHLNLLR